MKRIAWLFVAVLCFATMLNAKDKEKTMSGWICNSKCVMHNGNTATCDPNCAETAGEAVFISDSGKVMNISDQDVCASHMNKRVKAKADFTNLRDENTLSLMDIRDSSGSD